MKTEQVEELIRQKKQETILKIEVMYGNINMNPFTMNSE